MSIEDLKFTKDHEWVRLEGSTATIGITDYAAAQLGDIVYVDLPGVGDALAEGEVVGEIESTKSVGELFAPVNGTVAAINDDVVDAPELVNSDPFESGWLISVELDDAAVAAVSALLTHAQYLELVGK